MAATVDDVIKAIVNGDNGAVVTFNYGTKSITVQTKKPQKIGLIIFSNPAFCGFFTKITIEDSTKLPKVEGSDVHIYNGVQPAST